MNLKKLERYLLVNLFGPGPRLIKKKNLPGRGLTKVEKHWSKPLVTKIINTPTQLSNDDDDDDDDDDTIVILRDRIRTEFL